MNYYKVVIFFFILMLTAFFIRCERNAEEEVILEPQRADLTESTWILVDKKGKPVVKNQQQSKLVFLDENEFEVHKTFEYSGSTFRTPGRYHVEDSVITLKCYNNCRHLGNVYLYQEKRMKVEWIQADIVYGEGTEVFEKKDKRL